MDGHSPRLTAHDIKVQHSAFGAELRVPCTCGDPKCIQIHYLDPFKWERIIKPDNRAIAVSGIGAIKEVRSVLALGLKDAKDLIDASHLSKTRTSEQKHIVDGFEVTVRITYIPDNPGTLNHIVSVIY